MKLYLFMGVVLLQIGLILGCAPSGEQGVASLSRHAQYKGTLSARGQIQNNSAGNGASTTASMMIAPIRP